MTDADNIEHCVTIGDLIAELAARSPLAGANVGLWPGLTTYRFTNPTRPVWEEMSGLALSVVAQGIKAITDAGREYICDRSTYLVISSRLQFQSEIVEASAEKPCLCLVLQVEPSIVRKVSAAMLEPPIESGGPEHADRRPDACLVSELDDRLMCALVRFLHSVSNEPDRRVLSSLYLQEIVYRVLQREQFTRTLHFANRCDTTASIAGAMTYIRTHLAEPLTVAILANQVNLSASAFTRTFRDLTGTSPYRFVKEMRLEHARRLLLERRLGVGDVAAAVGYTSTSHFIKEFRGRFGTTPRGYFDIHSVERRLHTVHRD